MYWLMAVSSSDSSEFSVSMSFAFPFMESSVPSGMPAGSIIPFTAPGAALEA